MSTHNEIDAEEMNYQKIAEQHAKEIYNQLYRLAPDIRYTILNALDYVLKLPLGNDRPSLLAAKGALEKNVNVQNIAQNNAPSVMNKNEVIKEAEWMNKQKVLKNYMQTALAEAKQIETQEILKKLLNVLADSI